VLGMVSITAPSLQGFTNMLLYSHLGWSLCIPSFWSNLSCRVTISLDFFLCKTWDGGYHVIDYAKRNIQFHVIFSIYSYHSLVDNP